MKTRTIREENELLGFAREVIGELTEKAGATVVALTGDLGAGKTAFVKAFALELGVSENVTSPTFVIMKSYSITKHPFFKTLTHIDAYRIESEDEMRVLGYHDVISDPRRVVCVEWPERISGIIPDNSYRISLVIEDDGSRTITYGT